MNHWQHTLKQAILNEQSTFAELFEIINSLNQDDSLDEFPNVEGAQ